MEYLIDPRNIHLIKNKYIVACCFQRQMIISIYLMLNTVDFSKT